jgi:hypothetical protein
MNVDATTPTKHCLPCVEMDVGNFLEICQIHGYSKTMKQEGAYVLGFPMSSKFTYEL